MSGKHPVRPESGRHVLLIALLNFSSWAYWSLYSWSAVSANPMGRANEHVFFHLFAMTSLRSYSTSQDIHIGHLYPPRSAAQGAPNINTTRKKCNKKRVPKRHRCAPWFCTPRVGSPWFLLQVMWHLWDYINHSTWPFIPHSTLTSISNTRVFDYGNHTYYIEAKRARKAPKSPPCAPWFSERVLRIPEFRWHVMQRL